MFSITICFGPTGTLWSLLFKTEEKFVAALARCNDVKIIDIEDDYGQRLTVHQDIVHAVLSENCTLSKLAHQERMLHDARTKAGAQKAAQTDPALREAMTPRGPTVISPFNMNGPR